MRESLASGAARAKFKQMIAWQGGDAAVVDDTGRLPQAGHVHQLTATRAGYLQSLDALLVGRTAVALGAGRDKKADQVDLSAGILLHKKPGDPCGQAASRFSSCATTTNDACRRRWRWPRRPQ